MRFEKNKLFIEWYEKNKRDLPWRGINDPYRIWISEIILQQTRVVQGMEYYFRFLRRFPDVASLASAEQEEVLKYWQGLGYYSRARNLHEAAKDVQTRFQGIFPQRYEDIRSLKGIGDYTAAAIASFAWNQPYPVVDGNVYRVLGRLFAIETPMDSGKGKKQYMELARTLMDSQQAGIYNQAVMEFGALQCVPQNPVCNQCPFVGQCAGYASGNPLRFPVKQHKTKTRDRYFNYFHIIYNGNMYLHHRTEKDIWEGLFELPLIETDRPVDFAELKETSAFKELFGETGDAVWSVVESGIKHVLSHQILHATFYKVEIQTENHQLLYMYAKTPLTAVGDYPVPRLIYNYLSKIS